MGKPDGLLARGCGLDLLNRYHSPLERVEPGVLVQKGERGEVGEGSC